MNQNLASRPTPVLPPARYAVRLARTPEERRQAQKLRYTVFNLELNEGLENSHLTGTDQDRFDAVCDHLIVEHATDREVVGTYRLQTGAMAAAHLGYYSETEFEFAVYERLRAGLIELGRACVHREHRNLQVLGLLWKGITHYAQARGSRYLIGCSSLTSQDPAVGASAYANLCRHHLVTPELQTQPRPDYACELGECAPQPVTIPKLLRAYLSVGARICGPPAIDRAFKTIDFLTLMDLEGLTPAARSRFMS